MTLQYTDIFSAFLSKCTDPSFLEQDEDFVYESMREWLHSAVSIPHIRKIFSALNLDDELMEFEFELNTSVDEVSDRDFVIEILSKGLVIKWLEPQVNSKLHISQFFGGKEQRWFSQAQHLSELKSMLADAKTELKKMIRDYGYINNSYTTEV